MSPDLLREGAILVADAHCAPWRSSFIDFLRAIENGEIHTPQLVLMGDVFDLLFGPIESTHALNTQGIDLLNRLSHTIEVVYLEGNHDFLLTDIFPSTRVIGLQSQPWMVRFEDKTVALSHGDSVMGWEYALYTSLIRNPLLLKLLRLIDKAGKGFIVKALERAMRRKNHCRKIEDFETLIGTRIKRMKNLEADILIEGHFHQNRSFSLPGIEYFNLGAFACNERYFSVQSTQNQPLLRECSFS